MQYKNQFVSCYLFFMCMCIITFSPNTAICTSTSKKTEKVSPTTQKVRPTTMKTRPTPKRTLKAKKHKVFKVRTIHVKGQRPVPHQKKTPPKKTRTRDLYLFQHFVTQDMAAIPYICGGSRSTYVSGMHYKKAQKNHLSYAQHPGTCAYALVQCSPSYEELHVFNWVNRRSTYVYTCNTKRTICKMNFEQIPEGGSTQILLKAKVSKFTSGCQKIVFSYSTVVNQLTKVTKFIKAAPRQRP